MGVVARLLGPGRLRRWLLPWALGLGTLLNLAYPMYVHYDFSHSLDTRSYLRLASGRFDSVNVTRRYRVLVPAAAGVLAQPIAQVYGKIWPQRPAGEWPRRFAFYLVNCALLSAAGATWWRAGRLAGASAGPMGVALLAVLSSRWAEYTAGLPLTDSLYSLVFGLSYYAGRRGLAPGKVGAGWAVAVALLVGPLAKESFVFLLPWLLWYGRGALGWRWQALALSGGLLALLAVHYFLDNAAGAAHSTTVTNALAHFENVPYSLRRGASPKGLGELLSIFGLFTLPVLAALLRPGGRRALAPVLGWPEATLLGIVVVHMLLSSELGRMGYFFAPVFAVALALVTEATLLRLRGGRASG
jgi:hypothetical protein